MSAALITKEDFTPGRRIPFRRGCSGTLAGPRVRCCAPWRGARGKRSSPGRARFWSRGTVSRRGSFARSAGEWRPNPARSPASLLVVEPAQAGADLDSVDAGVIGGKSGVGDVQPAHFQVPMRLPVAHVNADRNAWRKVYVRNARRHIAASKENAATEFKVRRHAAARLEKPLEGEGGKASAINHAAGLKDQIHRHRVHGVLKT